MEITLEQLLEGKGPRIKNNEYYPTKYYVEPFIERMKDFTNDFRIQVKLPDQITLTEDKTVNMEDITFNRVWIQAVLPEEFTFDNHDEVVGMIYGIDVRKPVVKLYRGGLNKACTNLCIFDANFVECQDFPPESAINFKSISYLMEQTNTLKVWLEKLHNTYFNCNDYNINESLGKWIRNSIDKSYDSGFGKVKIASSTPIDAYKLLFKDENSDYFVKGETTSMFNIYNAFTQLITHDKGRDIMNKCEKTLLLKRILDID